jgi:hypothetical protein
LDIDATGHDDTMNEHGHSTIEAAYLHLERSILGYLSMEACPWISTRPNTIDECELSKINDTQLQEALPDLRILELQQQRPHGQPVVTIVTVPIKPSIKPHQTLGALLFASILAINSSLVSLPVGCKFL